MPKDKDKKHKKNKKCRWKSVAKLCNKYKKRWDDNLANSHNKKDLKKIKKFKKKYGFDYTESWDLDSYALVYILPRLAYLRDHHSVPAVFTTSNTLEVADRQWTKILDDIIDGFIVYLKALDDVDMSEKDKRAWDKATTYFTKYFNYLWY